MSENGPKKSAKIAKKIAKTAFLGKNFFYPKKKCNFAAGI